MIKGRYEPRPDDLILGQPKDPANLGHDLAVELEATINDAYDDPAQREEALQAVLDYLAA